MYRPGAEENVDDAARCRRATANGVEVDEIDNTCRSMINSCVTLVSVAMSLLSCTDSLCVESYD